MRSLRFALLTAFASFVVVPAAAAQDTGSVTGFEPNISVSFGAAPTRDVGTTGEKFSDRDFGLGVSVPIKGGWNWDGTKLSGFRLMVHARFHVDSAELPYEPDRRTLYSGEAGLSAVHILDRNKQLAWSLGAGIAEDRDATSNTKVRLSASLIMHHRSNDKLAWLYGGAYIYVFGKGRLLPILGVLWRPNKETLVSVIGPVSARVRHQSEGSRLSLGAKAGMHGNQFQVADNRQYFAATGDLRLRVRELRVGGELGYILGRNTALFAEAGVAAARNLTFTDGKTELSSFKVANGGYASVSLRLSFSKRPRWEGVGEW